MTQLALWLGFATIALAVVTFVYFAVRAGRSGLIPFYYRGHLATALGIGAIGVGLTLSALRSARTTGPDGVSWLGVSVMAAGAAIWVVGEVWMRATKKHIEFLQRLTAIAEESRAQKERDGEESPPSP